VTLPAIPPFAVLPSHQGSKSARRSAWTSNPVADQACVPSAARLPALSCLALHTGNRRQEHMRQAIPSRNLESRKVQVGTYPHHLTDTPGTLYRTAATQGRSPSHSRLGNCEPTDGCCTFPPKQGRLIRRAVTTSLLGEPAISRSPINRLPTLPYPYLPGATADTEQLRQGKEGTSGVEGNPGRSAVTPYAPAAVTNLYLPIGNHTSPGTLPTSPTSRYYQGEVRIVPPQHAVSLPRRIRPASPAYRQYTLSARADSTNRQEHTRLL
jgi:hypothetical protein